MLDAEMLGAVLALFNGPASGGADGVSPTVEIVPVENGNQIIITDKEGAHTFTVFNGTNGANGVDGTTPVKGKDYFTEEDIAELKAEILPSIEGVAEGSVLTVSEGALSWIAPTA
mgnify:CR=1 FL=1